MSRCLVFTSLPRSSYCQWTSAMQHDETSYFEGVWIFILNPLMRSMSSAVWINDRETCHIISHNAEGARLLLNSLGCFLRTMRVPGDLSL
ncbi:hypothetical protein C8R45DRAFT_1040439 [Mycena sanguinolenta]|nr:hypothetical protein C8R45DRAFT_1040439 [Mycena sanguinolenta]